MGNLADKAADKTSIPVLFPSYSEVPFRAKVLEKRAALPVAEFTCLKDIQGGQESPISPICK